MRAGWASVSWWQVISSKYGSWRVSWNPPRPCVFAPVSGVTTIIGVWFQYAAATAVTKLVMPGPFCAMHTATSPFARVYPSAMWAAPCSCATSTNRTPARSKMSSPGMNAEPTIPNATFTPFTRSVSTNAS